MINYYNNFNLKTKLSISFVFFLVPLVLLSVDLMFDFYKQSQFIAREITSLEYINSVNNFARDKSSDSLNAVTKNHDKLQRLIPDFPPSARQNYELRP